MRSIHLWPLLLAPVLGCELVADIHDRSVFDEPVGGQGGAGAGGQPTGQGGAGAGGQAGSEPQAGTSQGGAGQGPGGTDAGMSGSSGQGGSAPTCAITFTSTTGTGLRLGNLVPSQNRYDVCIKPQADADYGQVTPLLHGADCPNGLAYKQISASVDLAPGLYDVKFIASSAADCGDPGVGTSAGVTVTSGSIRDVFLTGNATTFTPRIFAESVPQPIINTAFRFLHVAEGVGSVDVMIADAPTPPANITAFPLLFEKVGYLALPTDSPFAKGAVDANGFLQIAGPGDVNIGIADSPSSGSGGSAGASGAGGGAGKGGSGGSSPEIARLVRTGQFSSNVALSMFLVGTASDPGYPQETLLCEDFVRDEQAPYLSRCNGGQTQVQPTRFGTLNAQLTGIFAAYEPSRRPAVIKAAADAADDVDVLCVGEAWAKSDKDAIVAAAASRFAYQFAPTSDEKTPIGDPTDQDGKVPAPWTSPPCTSDDVTKLGTLTGCLSTKCPAEGTSGEQATTQWGTCASSSSGCQFQFAPLLFAADKSCYSCALVQAQSYQTMADIKSNCTTQNDRRFAFRGNHGAVLLSKHEIVDSELVMLPATEWRVGVLRAGVKLPNKSVVDVYCTTLTTPADSNTRPYTGQYGEGLSQGAAWNAENKLQAAKLAALVRERSRYRRAVVMGELYAGPEVKDGATQVLDAYTPDSWQVIASSFGVATAPGYQPACTQCASNPLVGGTRNYWTSHVLLFNASISDVSATSIGLTGNTVAVTDSNGQAQMVPVSTHYSLRSTVNFGP